MKKQIVFWVLLSTLLTTSCEKALFKKSPSNQPVNNFDLLWQTLDKQYALFTYKKIDWTAVYAEYRPLISNDMTNEQLFNVMDSMLRVLKDGHIALSSPFKVSRGYPWYLEAPENFNSSIIQNYYLKNSYAISGPLINSVIDSVGYIYYGSFNSTLTNEQVNFVLNQFNGLKGLILDVRDNVGGDSRNVTLLASHFTDVRRLVAYSYYKSGPGHNDFYQPQETYIEPSSGGHFNGQVVVLTNRSCYSATNDFVAAMKLFPNIIMIGDTTGGGGGLPFTSVLPNGWKYSFSSTMTLTPDGFNIEAGIPPHIALNMTREQEAAGIDTILSYAINFINKR